jgi:hypothetical protein
VTRYDDAAGVLVEEVLVLGGGVIALLGLHL